MIKRKKILILFIAILSLTLNITPAFATVWSNPRYIQNSSPSSATYDSAISATSGKTIVSITVAWNNMKNGDRADAEFYDSTNGTAWGEILITDTNGQGSGDLVCPSGYSPSKVTMVLSTGTSTGTRVMWLKSVNYTDGTQDTYPDPDSSITGITGGSTGPHTINWGTAAISVTAPATGNSSGAYSANIDGSTGSTITDVTINWNALAGDNIKIHWYDAQNNLIATTSYDISGDIINAGSKITAPANTDHFIFSSSNGSLQGDRITWLSHMTLSDGNDVVFATPDGVTAPTNIMTKNYDENITTTGPRTIQWGTASIHVGQSLSYNQAANWSADIDGSTDSTITDVTVDWNGFAGDQAQVFWYDKNNHLLATTILDITDNAGAKITAPPNAYRVGIKLLSGSATGDRYLWLAHMTLSNGNDVVFATPSQVTVPTNITNVNYDQGSNGTNTGTGTEPYYSNQLNDIINQLNQLKNQMGNPTDLNSVIGQLNQLKNQLGSTSDPNSVIGGLSGIKNQLGSTTDPNSVIGQLGSIKDKLGSASDPNSVIGQLNNSNQKLDTIANGQTANGNKLDGINSKLGSTSDPNSVIGQLGSIKNQLGSPTDPDSVSGQLAAVKGQLGSSLDPNSVIGQLNTSNGQLANLNTGQNTMIGQLGNIGTTLSNLGNYIQTPVASQPLGTGVLNPVPTFDGTPPQITVGSPEGSSGGSSPYVYDRSIPQMPSFVDSPSPLPQSPDPSIMPHDTPIQQETASQPNSALTPQSALSPSSALSPQSPINPQTSSMQAPLTPNPVNMDSPYSRQAPIGQSGYTRQDPLGSSGYTRQDPLTPQAPLTP